MAVFEPNLAWAAKDELRSCCVSVWRTLLQRTVDKRMLQILFRTSTLHTSLRTTAISSITLFTITNASTSRRKQLRCCHRRLNSGVSWPSAYVCL